MAKTKVVIYGLSTEGYEIARQMAIGGADVSIVDELNQSATSLTADIAKICPKASSLQEDDAMPSLEPISVALSNARYLFFAPRIRKTGQDTKTEIHSKFKDAIQPLKKNASIVYCLPLGLNGNNENISLLEHITGFEAGKSVSYYYYPLGGAVKDPQIIGSFNAQEDEKLLTLLAAKKPKNFVSLSTSEHLHAIEILTQFSALCSVLEVFKLIPDKQTREDLSTDEFRNLFFDDMVKGLYDLRTLGASFEGAGTLTYLINGGIKGLDGYIKRLIDEIRATLKKNDIKASRTRIALSWTMDKHETRGDRMEMSRHLANQMRDHIGEVGSYEDGPGMFQNEKTLVVVACSKADYDKITKGKKDADLILVKANPLCEVIQ